VKGKSDSRKEIMKLTISGLLLVTIGLSLLISILFYSDGLIITSIGPNNPAGEAVFCILAAVTIAGGISVLFRRCFKFGLLAGIISTAGGAILFSPIPLIASIVAIVLLASTKEKFSA
jgi:hypothetical protein